MYRIIEGPDARAFRSEALLAGQSGDKTFAKWQQRKAEIQPSGFADQFQVWRTDVIRLAFVGMEGFSPSFWRR